LQEKNKSWHLKKFQLSYFLSNNHCHIDWKYEREEYKRRGGLFVQKVLNYISKAYKIKEINSFLIKKSNVKKQKRRIKEALCYQ